MKRGQFFTRIMEKCYTISEIVISIKIFSKSRITIIRLRFPDKTRMFFKIKHESILLRIYPFQGVLHEY